jgi:hypothetical protein
MAEGKTIKCADLKTAYTLKKEVMAKRKKVAKKEKRVEI